jgi:serine/threonine-protein kinase
VASFAFQRLLGGERWRELLPFAWAVADVALVTALLRVYPVWRGPAAIGYPVLIAAAGLWFRVAVVWFTAALVAAVYAAQCVVQHVTVDPLDTPHHHLIFLVGLLVLAFVTTYQVKRVRALSRYYQNRPLP